MDSFRFSFANFRIDFEVLARGARCDRAGSITTGFFSLCKFWIHPQHTPNSSSPSTPGTLLLLGFCRRDRLSGVDICFRVGELLGMFNLQAPVFVGDDVRGED